MLALPDISVPPSGEDVHSALERICSSPPFGTSPKLTSFLRFVVETTLSGRGHRLKGYTVGVEALGRGENFNPQLDPIVRVEAIRLRTALARYYSGAGCRDPLVIEMPRGHYVTHFRWREPRAGPRAPNLVQAIRQLRRFLDIRVILQAPPNPR